MEGLQAHFLSLGRHDVLNELLAYEKEYTKNMSFQLLKLQEQNETLTNPIQVAISKEKKKQQELKRFKQGILYYFVTINPDTSKISLDDFITKVKNMLSKVCVSSPSYAVIEQRGTLEKDNVGTGYHAHLLLKRTNFENYNIAKFYKNLKNPFRHCMDINNEQLFKINSLQAPYTDCDGKLVNIYQDKLDYIQDQNKWGIEKNDKQHADLIFRQNNQISPIYQK